MKSSLSIITVFVAVGLSLSTVNASENPTDLGPLTVRKATPQDDLSVFKETDRLDSYQETLSITNPEEKLGVYVACLSSGEMVGIHSISPPSEECPFAEEMTDILEKYQGKRYGTQLRRYVAQQANLIIGTKVKCTSYDQRPPIRSKEETILKGLYSDNEWMWGQNYPSLKSSLNVDYKPILLTHAAGGCAHMVYSKNIVAWSDSRIASLIDVAKKVFKASTLKELSLKDIADADGTEIVAGYLKILNDLDLTQDTEMVTFLSICKFMTEELKGKFGATDALKNKYKELSVKDLNRLGNVGGDHGHKQKFPLKYFSIFGDYKALANEIRKKYLIS